MQIVRQSSFVSSPWKNGGGTTREAMRVPAVGAAFRWRVSVAQIDASGPFSNFAGYERKMVLLRGSGLRLRATDGEPSVLRAPGDLVEFDGAVAMHCDLLAGPCTDLNLMVSKAIPAVRVWVQELTEPHVAAASLVETMLLVSISGRLTISGDNDGPVCLDPWDLLVVWPGEQVTLQPVLETPAPLAFFATLTDTYF